MLEEDIKTGGGGIPVGKEEFGAGLDGLEGRKGRGPGPQVRIIRCSDGTSCTMSKEVRHSRGRVFFLPHLTTSLTFVN